MAPCTTETILPFRTFRQPVPGGGLRVEVDFVSSAAHFYYSEHFRGVNEKLRREILLQPTAREARKLAKFEVLQQRPDWMKQRGRVMVCGIWLQAIEHPWLFDRIRAKKYHYEGVSQYWYPEGKERAFPKLLDYFEKRLTKPCRVFLYGFGAPVGNFRFCANMSKLFSRTRPDELLLGAGRGLDMIAERWAIDHYIPIRRRTQLSRLHRSSDASITAAFAEATHGVIFADSLKHEAQRMRNLAEAAKLTTRVLLPPISEVGLRDPGKVVVDIQSARLS